jgi:diguanylate cyclase (GGDEF)-like protein
VQGSLQTAITLLPAITAAVFAWDALRLRARPAGIAIAALLSTAAIWTGGYAGEILAASLEGKLLWAKVQYFGIAMLPIAWLAFADGYTGGRWRWDHRWPLLLPVSFVTLVMAWTNELHGLIWRSTEIARIGGVSVLVLQHGTWFYVHFAFSYVLLAAGSIRIVRELWRRPYFGRQAAALVTSAVGPWAGNLLYVSGLNPIAPLDLTPFAFAASAVTLTVAVGRYGFLDIVPVAHASVLASMADSVFVLDKSDRVIDANPAARANFCRHLDPVGRDVREVIPSLPEAHRGHAAQLRYDFAHTIEDSITHYSLSSTPLSEQGRSTSGRILVISNVTDQRLAEERIHTLAHQDALTGLPNREVFRSRFERALRGARRNGRHAACLFIDLDNFKRINDHYGHSVGDAVLRQAVQRIESGLRANDTLLTASPDTTLARFGGDEFVILLEGLNDPGDAVAPAERVLAALEAPHRHGDSRLSLNASVGVAVYPEDGEDAETLLRNADAAMYAAKGAGGNRVQFFTSRIRDAVTTRIETESELHRALEQDAFVLAYQPQFCLGRDRVVTFEALLRWNHPERGLVRPGDFVAVAEQSGLIIPIGEWVLQRAFSDWARLAATTGTDCRLAINLSPRQFADPRLVQCLRETLERTGLPPSQLEIELTEGALMEDAGSTQELLEDLQSLGVSLAVDDFGSGYSSLAYMRTFPLDLIKIDRAFIAGMLDDHRCANLVRAMIAMGHNLGLEVVCEGIEQPQQLEALRSAGCDRVQGYLLGRPMPIEAVAELLGETPQRRLAASP